MKKHLTQAELLRTQKLIRSGITDISEIQKYVFSDASCIQQVLDKTEKEARREAAGLDESVEDESVEDESVEVDPLHPPVNPLDTPEHPPEHPVDLKPAGAAAKAAALKDKKIDPLC